MKVFRTAAIIAVMLAGPAYGQAKAPAAADSAYKRSLGNIPDKPPADPWGIARDTDAPKAATKVQTKKTKTGSTTTN
jgi:hypothetical protein